MSEDRGKRISGFSYGTASLLASLCAFALCASYWVWYWAWGFFGFYKDFKGDLSGTGILLLAVSVLTTPPAALGALVCGALGLSKAHEKHKKRALAGLLIGFLLVPLYLMYFCNTCVEPWLALLERAYAD